jgi:serine-type D-Ala-D-Ala carboxypeptidase/endopeptidase (penicillin-binding protein 4)
MLVLTLAGALAPSGSAAQPARMGPVQGGTGPSAPLTPQPPETEAAPVRGGGARPGPGVGLRPGPSGDLPRPPRDPAERREWLRTHLDELFNAPWLARSKVSVLAVEADSGKAVYARSEKTLLNAASNVKLVTSAAALALLGPEYRWKTTLSAVGPASGAPLPPGGEISGDLYLRGFGDPTLMTEDLATMVGDIVALGLHRVRGSLVVDDSFFDGATGGPAYDQKNESTALRAPSSATSLDGNVVAVTVIPASAPGAPARVVVEPSSPYFSVSGRVVSANDGPAAPQVETKDEGGGRTQVLVSGRVRIGTDPRTIYRRVVQPSLFVGYTLRQLLERRGISVGKGVRIGGAPAQGLRVLSAHESAPLAVAVQELNKRSNNFAAEQIIRTLGAEVVGRPGTWDKGIEAVSRYMTNIGVGKAGYQMSNGSGLSDSNRFSAEQITAVLRAAARDFRVSAEFMASLAVAGTDGTVAHRMGGTLAERYVRAKTGTLASVSCLSGFVGSPGHVPLVFSILMNDVTNAVEARRTQDRAAELLVAYLEGDPGSRP